MEAFDDVRPALGANEEDLEALTRNGLIDYGPTFRQLVSNSDSSNPRLYDGMVSVFLLLLGTLGLALLVHQLQSSRRTDSLSVLLEGPTCSGKTTLAAHIAHLGQFSFVKVVTTTHMVGFGENSKCNLFGREDTT